MPGEPQPTEFGTQAGGFRISYARFGHSWRLDGWGYWGDEVAATFTKEVEVASRALIPPVDFVFTATALKPQGDSGQAALRALMQCLSRLDLSSATLRSDNILTRMQLTRLASACGLEGRVKLESAPT